MLRRIALRDFVIVHELDLDLAAGFTVLTGETGAGKSILIDAVQLALGGRAEAGVVREGAARCEVAAEFDLPPALRGWLADCGFDADDHLLLRRVVDAQGKSRAWINGGAATATQLRDVGEHLVDIHGQHAWQSLTRPASVRGLLDAYAGLHSAGALDALQAAWQAWRAAQAALEQARTAQDSLQRERERLAWQIGELDKLAPQPGEWDDLNTQHKRLSNAQALLDAAQGALDQLQDGESAALDGLARAGDLLAQQEHVEPEFTNLVAIIASAQAQVQDVTHTLHGWLRRTELDPQRLGELDDRLSQWMSLARRFKRQPGDLPDALAEWKAELSRLDAAADLGALQRACDLAHTGYQKAARAVSAARIKAAPQLAQATTAAMQGLGMQGGRFDVALRALDEPAAHGLEDVEFLVAGHAGSTPRPVGKVASGGELSRIALAIAVTTSQLGQAGTLIFDEVDSGVGGAVADTVGRLMKQLGRDRQVLAVTHLPQVAACADHHLVVSKQAAAGSVRSGVAPVAGEARVSEIARMLGGERLSGTSLAHAKEMLGFKP